MEHFGECAIHLSVGGKHYNTKRPNSVLDHRTSCSGNHRSDGVKINHALPFKLDHSGGADQCLRTEE